MPELKQRFEELERLPAPDLQRRIQIRIQRLQQPDSPLSVAEQAWRHRERLWPSQVLATAAVIVFALVLGVALLHARSRAPVQVHPSPSVAPQPLPSPSITGAYPRGFYPGSLHMVSPKVGWNGVAYVETSDAGLHWRVISSSPATIFNQINQIKGGLTSFVLDATHAWMTGATNHGLVVIWTVDGGHTWSASAPLPTLIQTAVQLDFIDAQHGWLVVDTAGSASPNSRAIFATSDGGRRWSEIARASESDGSFLGRLAAGCTPSGITFISADYGWLTYDCNRASGVLSPHSGPVAAVTRDGGRSWAAVPLPSYPSGSGYFSASPPVFTLNSGILPVFFGGIGPSWTAIYETTDAGRTWSFRQLPFRIVAPDHLPPHFIDARTGWAVKQTGPIPPSAGVDCYVVTCAFVAELYGTTDGGATWKLLSRLVPAADAVAFFDAKVGYYAWSENPFLEGSPGGIMKTTDGGRSWSVVRPVLEGQG